MRYAEVIGDPIAQSKSPAIHKGWLSRLGMQGDYRAVQVRSHELVSYLERRRRDPDWLGCNATIPHKQAIADLIDAVTPEAACVGAVNCVVRDGDKLVGWNSDVDGIAAALDDLSLEARTIAVIGAGGAARAMLAYLQRRSPSEVIIVARDERKVAHLRDLWPSLAMTFQPIADAQLGNGAALIVNASPLGMTGSEAMPQSLIDRVAASQAALFVMVYQPLETDFIRAGKVAGAHTIDGLTMLIGQARRAFSLFFGAEPPAGDEEVRANILSSRTA